jgi:hypothetical protein
LCRNWWNEDWQRKPKYSEKSCPSATVSTTNPTWLDPGLNPGLRGGKPKDQLLAIFIQIRSIEDTSSAGQDRLQMPSRRCSVCVCVCVCVCSIPCDCGRSYIGETSRGLEARTKEHKYNLTKYLLKKLAQRAYEEGHKICWNEAKVLQIEPNAIHRKWKESDHLSVVDHPISQTSLAISSIWTHIMTAELKYYNSVQCRSCVKIVFLFWNHTENLPLLWWLRFW